MQEMAATIMQHIQGASSSDELQTALTEIVAGALLIGRHNGLPVEQMARQGTLLAFNEGH